ncbi:16S rRNA (uracil(1498)-N(3))-methyltransferase [Salinisphaera orenii]|uniref:Ribosomal RNA small subunit methyltransferase E n=1 Tax=Salinisphaera orenii YIM 95161 TaxID=1051139 RepID=A0A423PDF7_9GAMM|nr:16S rRNA (uracil(1498)-N(3))-methyltransferase [Salinisphaera halophila]ROO22404.1 16S rRNA methyltransferase [Salinisphaera halophila YIM 95161]
MSRRAHVPRVFVDGPLAAGETVEPAEAKRHHLATVLRLKAGAPVTLFNGDGFEYAARIDHADRKRITLAVEARHSPQRESPLSITLYQAIARGDRMDFALAKAVELGVTAIRPVFTERGKVKLEGERLAKKQAHWQAVVESAAEQSGRLVRPALEAAKPLSQALAEDDDVHRLRLMLAPTATAGLHATPKHAHIALLIGPESGLSDNEIDTANAAGWQAVSLGPRVLRTETAGMAALAALQALWGDLGD